MTTTIDECQCIQRQHILPTKHESIEDIRLDEDILGLYPLISGQHHRLQTVDEERRASLITTHLPSPSPCLSFSSSSSCRARQHWFDTVNMTYVISLSIFLFFTVRALSRTAEAVIQSAIVKSCRIDNARGNRMVYPR